MSRFSLRFLVLFLVLTVTLLWPLSVFAQDPRPNTCLPSCYAYNKALPEGDGTEQSPWPTDDLSGLRSKMAAAVQNTPPYYGTLYVTTCDDAQPPTCTAVLYTYDSDGNEESREMGEVPVPDVGVPIPFHYILGFGGLLAVLLVAAGLFLRRRAQQGI